MQLAHCPQFPHYSGVCPLCKFTRFGCLIQLFHRFGCVIQHIVVEFWRHRKHSDCEPWLGPLKLQIFLDLVQFLIFFSIAGKSGLLNPDSPKEILFFDTFILSMEAEGHFSIFRHRGDFVELVKTGDPRASVELSLKVLCLTGEMWS